MKRSAVAAIIALFLVACGGMNASDPSKPTAAPTTSPYRFVSQTPTVLLSATSVPATDTLGPPTETPTPSSTPRPNATLKPGRGVLLTSIQMFDSQNGWGFDSQQHILRTRDGGKTWQDVTPSTGYYDSEGFFALDSAIAWATFTIGLYSNHQTAHIWSTRDGGETWTPSQEFRLDLDQNGEPYSSEFYLPQGMQFIDRQTGWFLAAVSYHMNAARSLLFHTTDGGETWSPINSRIGLPDTCVAVGFVFTDRQRGWMGGNCFIQQVVWTPIESIFAAGGWFISETSDGGNTYAERTLIPAPAELQQPEVLSAEGNCGEIRLVRIEDDVIGIEWGCSIFTPLKPDFRFFALSPDGGRTWTSWKSTGNESFLNADYGWRLLAPGELQQTIDGGSNWVTIKNVTWDDAKFEFVSEQEGWAIASVGQGRVLLHTLNGGQTWTDLHPIVGP